MVDQDGEIDSQLAKFEYTGGLVGEDIPVDARLTDGSTLGIVSLSSGSPVMISL